MSKNGYDYMNWNNYSYDEYGNFYDNNGNMIIFTDTEYPIYEIKKRNMNYVPDEYMWNKNNEKESYYNGIYLELTRIIQD